MTLPAPSEDCPLTPAAFAYLARQSPHDKTIVSLLTDMAVAGALDGLLVAAEAGLAQVALTPTVPDEQTARTRARRRLGCVLVALNHADPAVAGAAASVAEAWRSRAAQLDGDDLAELLRAARKARNHAQMRWLVGAGANLNALKPLDDEHASERGRSQLYSACVAGDVEGARILLDGLGPLSGFPFGLEAYADEHKHRNVVEAACFLAGSASLATIDHLRTALYPRLAPHALAREMDALGHAAMSAIGLMKNLGTDTDHWADWAINLVNAGARLPEAAPGAPTSWSQLLCARVGKDAGERDLLSMLFEGDRDFAPYTRFLETLLDESIIAVDYAGAPVPNEAGPTLLHRACYSGRTDLVRLLLARGADAARLTPPIEGQRYSCIELCRNIRRGERTRAENEIVPMLQAALARQAIDRVTGAATPAPVVHASAGQS